MKLFDRKATIAIKTILFTWVIIFGLISILGSCGGGGGGGDDGEGEGSTGGQTPEKLIFPTSEIFMAVATATSTIIDSDGLKVDIAANQIIAEFNNPQLDEENKNAQKLIKDGDLMLHEGYIALQAESQPVEFRKIEILDLNK